MALGWTFTTAVKNRSTAHRSQAPIFTSNPCVLLAYLRGGSWDLTVAIRRPSSNIPTRHHQSLLFFGVRLFLKLDLRQEIVVACIAVCCCHGKDSVTWTKDRRCLVVGWWPRTRSFYHPEKSSVWTTPWKNKTRRPFKRPNWFLRQSKRIIHSIAALHIFFLMGRFSKNTPPLNAVNGSISSGLQGLVGCQNGSILF